MPTAAFQDAPEELDVTIMEPAGEQSGAVAQAAAALTAEVVCPGDLWLLSLPCANLPIAIPLQESQMH